MMTVFPGASGGVVDPRTYLQKRQTAALAGQVYNPAVGFTPIANSGHKYPFDFVRHNFEPRAAAAWTPNFKGGLLGSLFANVKTTFRGGSWRSSYIWHALQTAAPTFHSVRLV